jgi:integrase
MSVYSVKGKGWRYDFTQKGTRYTEAWFKTKKDAKEAEARKREELKNQSVAAETLTDTAFLELVNLWLDHLKAYRSERHYTDNIYHVRRWIKNWGKLTCDKITREMVEKFVLERSRVSPQLANKEIRYLRAVFNYGIKRRLLTTSPAEGIDFLPVEKKVRCTPSVDDVKKVLAEADRDTQDYLWVIWETMARMSEINRLTWNDVNLEQWYVVLHTRKKRGGHLTPRKVPMTQKLHEILSRRFAERDESKPWVFWHTFWSSKTGEKHDGPYLERPKIMRTLCKKAGVSYFRFHALRHSGASIMDNSGVPLGSIQRILGHENRKTTEIYLHSLGEAERQAMHVYENAKKSLTQSLTQNEGQ